MAEFNEARARLREARAAREGAANAAIAAKERLKRLTARRAALDRKSDPSDPEHLAAREQLATEHAEAEQFLKEQQSALAGTAERAAVAQDEFVRLADPRTEIGRLDDRVPILLFPVRLETRFKTVSAAGKPPRHELWVRIYPDDCSIDTFEPTLSEAELANAQLYWTTIWESGGIADQERGAWRGLVAGHGSDRARWIISQYTPVNIAQKPTKQLASDIILTVATEIPLTVDEEAAAGVFWRAVWRAEGDRAQQEVAMAALAAAVGATHAKQIAGRYVPVNLSKGPPPPLTRAQVNVSVASVIFPKRENLEVRQHSWSRAPRAVALPDRFVFIGYAAGKTIVHLGNAVPSPLIVGPDPSASGSEQLRQQDGDLNIPEPMRWMVDFDRAVEVGMGFRVDLDDTLAESGFDRILVIGLALSADEVDGQAGLEELIEHHQFSGRGFSLVPQGTPTNNTEGVPAGDTRSDDADASFDDLATGDLFTDTLEWREKRDGQWLAEYLGIDSAVLKHVRYAGGADQADARAMNAALWPATLGYWMETMMAPVLTPAAADWTREFFNRFVSGRGAVPAIRVGRQPYGILPATALSRLQWFRDPEGQPFGVPLEQLRGLSHLHDILRVMDADWAAMAAGVSFVGKQGDAQKNLLDIVGLHSGSVEFAQRYAESLEQLLNRLKLEGLGAELLGALTVAGIVENSVALLAKLGYKGAEIPDILNKFFFGKENMLMGTVVQEGPLSETEGVRVSTADGKRNYLQWLIDAANTSEGTLYLEQGFIHGTPPTALLYLLLHHALELGYHDTSVRAHVAAGLFAADQEVRAKRDAPFIHVAENASKSDSRYQLLYKTEPKITGSQTRLVGEYIGASLRTLSSARYLREQVQALEQLKDASTARLERAFTEHIDCCTYRLDAWLLGLVHYELALMRNLGDDLDTPRRRGIYLGAYAWLESVRSEDKVLTPVDDLPTDLDAIFTPEADPRLQRDSANQGFIHTPSLNHAVAAAVLRNGFLSDASEANRQTMAVNLTSERVRTALGMLEGIRGGQSLGALLGYQFERGLHDRHGLIEVDKFIYDLRKMFPLGSDRLNSTRSAPGVPIEAVEARNVVDGLAFIRHVKGTGIRTYPFGFALDAESAEGKKPQDAKTLPAAKKAEAAAVEAEVDRMFDSHDAVADLALAEGVYQAVLGNYDRVASTYEAYSKGHFPPEPEVVRVPASGMTLTHRVALHLESGVSPTLSPVPGVAITPRALGEPALNRWLAAVLPPADQVACVVSFRDTATTNTSVEREVTLADLELQPADLIHLVRGESVQAMSELDDRIVSFTVSAHAPRPDTPISIRYIETLTAPFSVFALMPLVRHLYAITHRSRPLRSTDLALTAEATIGQESAAFVDKQRMVLVRSAMAALRVDLGAFQADLEAALGDLDNHRAEIIANVETTVQALTALLARAAGFTIPQAGWGFVYDFKRRIFVAILTKVADLVTRWDERLIVFDEVMAAYDALPATTTDEHRFQMLQRSEHLISTTTTAPLPLLPDDLRAALLAQRVAFGLRRDEFAAVQETTRTSVTLLLDDVGALGTTAFDSAGLSFADQGDDIVRFAEDAARVAVVVGAEMDRRLTSAQALLDQHDAAEAAARVKALEVAAKALLGDDFVVVPEFELNSVHADEFANALAAAQSGSPFDFLVNTAGVDLPVDTWLYGVARVREKMRAWEQVVMFAGTLANAEPELTAIQLPFRPEDRWLGLEFPPDAAPDGERLLFTAHFATPFQKSAPQCGLLIDEWVEVIPSNNATTGITFHYDRPNCEAPQTMLLVTPPVFRGAWQWTDLVDALTETLDFAKRRAVEPAHVDATAYAGLLPATVMAVTVNRLTISTNLALNNNLQVKVSGP